MSKKNKQISQCAITHGAKLISHVGNPDSFLSTHPAWRFERADTEYRWSLKNAEFGALLSALTNFERMTWDQIFKQMHDNGRSSNHYISPDQMCREARERFAALNLEEHSDHVFSLRLNNKTRIFGLLYNGVFSVLWYETEHEICPSSMRHT